MILKTLLFCGLALTSIMSASEPNIQISSLEEHGVFLLSSAHPLYSKAFQPGRAKGYDVLSPYTVVIQNQSPQEVIAYTVLWDCTDFTGKSVRQTRAVFNFSSWKPGTRLVPAKLEPVALYPFVAYGQTWDSSDEAMVTRLHRFYSQQTSVHIILDSVMFADGTVVGPDSRRQIEQWEAWLEAEREVFKTAIETPEKDAANVLLTLAHGALGRNPDIHLNVEDLNQIHHLAGRFSAMAGQSSDYLECLDYARAFYVFCILGEAKEAGYGYQGVVTNLAKLVKGKIYPTVHRKDM